MQLGQTSAIHFASNVLSSLLGFLATVYIARMLGAEPLGIYHLALGVVSWLAIAGKVGISGAISKRVSEGVDQAQYTVAGISIISGLFLIISVSIISFRSHLVEYVGHPVTGYVILILLVVLLHGLINSLLVGFQLVHISGLLSPTKTGGRAIAQISLIAVGTGITGLFIGHIAGFFLVIGVGSYFVVKNAPTFKLPRKRHFESLVDFAKFSWLGSLQSKMFNYTDIVILGFFVSSGLIGIYAIAWNIAQFLIIFSGSLKSTLFPEMSAISAKNDPQSVAPIVNQSLSYGGLFLAPGLIGGALLGDRILRIYGPEFTNGALILTILILANLFMGYQNQMLNALNAIDRPDLSFRVNALFVVLNLTFNVILIFLYGWIGAAIATAFSVAASLVIATYMLKSLIDFSFPYREIGRQWTAALLMGTVVYGGLWIENTYRLLGHNFATVMILVVLGASTYFFVYLGISPRFRTTVLRNLPIKFSVLSN